MKVYPSKGMSRCMRVLLDIYNGLVVKQKTWELQTYKCSKQWRSSLKNVKKNVLSCWNQDSAASLYVWPSTDDSLIFLIFVDTNVNKWLGQGWIVQKFLPLGKYKSELGYNGVENAQTSLRVMLKLMTHHGPRTRSCVIHLSCKMTL